VLSITKKSLLWNPARIRSAAVALLAWPVLSFADGDPKWKPAGDLEIPEPMREFRGFWLTTVYNLDWPSKPGLPVEIQKLELKEIFDRAAQLNLNAVVLQVRTMCDAFYDSPIEPWSYYLTGELGKAPEPFYDPLEYAVELAHDRGLELHAWFNPFRAATASYGETAPEDHVSKQYPWLLRKDGTHYWLDPSSDFVRNRALTTIFDVVNRYDVDGVQIDDYFYPYPRKDTPPGLDDSENWQRHCIEFQIANTEENRANWRREIVNQFIQDYYAEVKRAKPWVKVGISPFGIWRPKNPEGIEGLDAWRLIYTDSRRWIREGWLDYFSPQLYWKRGGPQDFRKLYSWWQDQNVKGRHLWPGMATSWIGRRGVGEADGRGADEILEQISYTRSDLGKAPASGQMHWRWEGFITNRGGISKLITVKRYADRSIPPPSPWLAVDGEPVAPAGVEDLVLKKEMVEVKKDPDEKGEEDEDEDEEEEVEEKEVWMLSWKPGEGEGEAAPVRWWVIQTRKESKEKDADESWTTHRLLPSQTHSVEFNVDGIDAISVRSIGRIGELGPASSLIRD
jgi:uncharacterized lipoprotein YddW (UPF0748 family)